MKLQLSFRCSGKNMDLKIAIRYNFKMIVISSWFILMLLLIVLDRIFNLVYI